MTPTRELKEAKDPIANSSLLTDILKQYPQYFDSLLRRNDVWQIKIIYTQVDRKANDNPVFTNHYFNIDPKQQTGHGNVCLHIDSIIVGVLALELAHADLNKV